jgi:hypothetical protein
MVHGDPDLSIAQSTRSISVDYAIDRLLGSAPAYGSDGRQPRPRPSRHVRTTLHIRPALPPPGAAQTMITKEKYAYRRFFFRDHEITAKSRHNR